MTTANHTRARGRHRTKKAGAISHNPLRAIGGRMLTVVLIIALTATVAIGYGMVDNRWYRVIGVDGGSMTPTIDRGDLIFVSRPTDIAVGDIAVFRVDDHLVTHRIIGISADGSYITQGDANPSPDHWNGANVEVIGEYLFRLPLIGTAFSSGVGAWYTDQATVGVEITAAIPIEDS
jgi:signal peptidase I